RIKGVAGSSVIMLSLAYSVGMFINLALLLTTFKKDFSYKKEYGITKTFWQSFSASIIIGLVAYVMLQILDPYFSQDTTMGVFGHGFISAVVAMIAGVTVLYALKNEEIKLFTGAIRKKIWKTSIVHHGEI
ncbi:MAG: peptidoglycan biosynthesis protein MviN/MurJ (putative lipid II flippase), partial [Crocinitomicaceae bacterium]